MNPVYQITAQLDTLSSMASKWPPFGTKLGILPLAPKCTQHTKFQTIWTIGIDFGIWGIFVLVGKLLMHIPLIILQCNTYPKLANPVMMITDRVNTFTTVMAIFNLEVI